MKTGKRKRVVRAKYLHDFCQPCRQRKIKCDRVRPRCGHCYHANRQCTYRSWELAIRPQHSDESIDSNRYGCEADSPLDTTVDTAAMLRAQAVALFLRDRFPAPTSSIGPYSPHIQDSSLLHLCAQIDITTPLLEQALNTICLCHLSQKTREPGTIHAATLAQAKLLYMLRTAVQAHQPTPSLVHLDLSQETRSYSPCSTLTNLKSNAQSIMITIMLMSVAPPLPGSSITAQRQSAVHLKGALQFLKNYGLDFLTGHESVDTALIRQLQFLGSVVAIGRRQNLETQNAEWAQVPRVLLKEDLDIYQRSGYFASDPVRRWQIPLAPMPSSIDRNLIRAVFVPLPKLLETADTFSSERRMHTPQALHNATAAVQRADRIQVESVGPAIREAARTVLRPVISDTDEGVFDLGIEEHRFLLEYKFKLITQHYDFVEPRYTFPSVNLRYANLLVDCAILQVIQAGIDRDDLPSNWTGLDKDSIEQRARRTAIEICMHVHYISQRSCTAARFLRAFVTAAGNFFECNPDSNVERDWCRACCDATSERIERLLSQGTAQEPLCPVTETFELMAEGCHYKGCWAEKRLAKQRFLLAFGG